MLLMWKVELVAICGWLDYREAEEVIPQLEDVDQSLAQWMNCLLMIGRCWQGEKMKSHEIQSGTTLRRAAELYVVYGWRYHMEVGEERRQWKEATERSKRGTGEVEMETD